MKLKDDLAFTAADLYGDCKEGEYCVAGVFHNGFIEGFEKARELAAKILEGGTGNCMQ